MRLRPLIGATLMALVLLTGIGIAPVVAATTYTDPQGRFSFSVPDGYTPVQAQLTAPVVAGFVSPDPGGANFTVQVREATGTLDAATAELQKRYATGTDSQPGSGGIQPLTLGGVPAQRFDYFTNAQGSRFHIMLVVSITGGAQYILTFTAQEAGYDALISQTGIVLSSFAFTAAASAPAAQVSNGTAVYADPGGRFSFTIPIDFQRSKDPDLAKYPAAFEARSTNGVARIGFIIDFIDASSSPSINTLTQAARSILLDKQYSVVAEQAVTLGGQAAYRFDATKTDTDGYRIRAVQVVSIKDATISEILFVVEQARYEEYAARIQQVITSFAFGSTPAAPNPALPAPPAAPPTAPPSAPPPSAPPASSPPTAPPATPPPGRDNG
jgi:hypothetical protein